MNHERYVILELLGKGGSSYVYKIWDGKFRKIAVLKIIQCRNEKQRRELQTSIQLWKRLHHTAIIPIYDWRQEPFGICVFMEYQKGETWMTYVDRKQDVSDEVLALWIHRLLDVLIYLHKQKPDPILYIDIKPSNILCDTHNHVYLFDFDSCMAQGTSYIRCATKGYAPVEVFHHQASVQSDIYSFGICVYVLLHGCFPTTMCEKHPYDNWLKKCFHKCYKERYQSFVEVKMAFEEIVNRGDDRCVM